MSHSKEGLPYITDLPSVPRSLSTATFCGIVWKKAQQEDNKALAVLWFLTRIGATMLISSVHWAHHLPAPLHGLICSKSQPNQRAFLCSPGSITEQDPIWVTAILGYLQAHLPLYKGAGCYSAGYHWQASAWITQIKARDIHKISEIFSAMAAMDKIVNEKEIDIVLWSVL